MHLCICRNQIESITSVNWHVAVFDEAHKLKNDDSATYKAALQLHAVTNRMYGLSGTVMQVGYLNFWCAWDGLLLLYEHCCANARASMVLHKL